MNEEEKCKNNVRIKNEEWMPRDANIKNIAAKIYQQKGTNGTERMYHMTE